MSKSMGFRNSGKLDLSGKRTEYAIAGALLVVIIVALVFVVGQIWPSGGDSEMVENRAKCVKCGAELVVAPKDEMRFHRETGMEEDSGPVGTDCDKCKAEKSVFLMSRCPKCEKYYLSKQITDPDAFDKGGGKEICPHCSMDLFEWYKEHR